MIRDSTISGSSHTGVFGLRVRLVDSTVTGSGAACPPGETCCDLVAQQSVVVRGASTCGTSCANNGAGTPFGVCTDD